MGNKCPANPEAEVAAPVIGGDPEAGRRAEAVRSAAVGPAADDTAPAIATGPGRAVGRCPVVAVLVTVLHPFYDIAYHVIETEPIGSE